MTDDGDQTGMAKGSAAAEVSLQLFNTPDGVQGAGYSEVTSGELILEDHDLSIFRAASSSSNAVNGAAPPA